MKNLFEDWEWSDTWGSLIAVSVLALIFIAGYAAFQDHSVRFYYMSDHGSGQSRSGYCIDGYRQWYVNDNGVFCSDEIQKTISVLKELNDGLAARGALRK